MKKVLVIEDDEDIIELLRLHLKDLGCDVLAETNGLKGLECMENESYDLLILDLMLPDMDGLEICRRVRMKKNYIPILMLTAKVEELDKILGLEMGADDYLTKPFSVREFISRVKAIFRRIDMIKDAVKSESESTILFKDLEIDILKHKASKNGIRLSLTPKEFDLLKLLAQNPGRSYSREELLDFVWGYDFSGYEHTVNSHINRLRNKIESDISKPEYILTEWGVGYMFNEEI